MSSPLVWSALAGSSAGSLPAQAAAAGGCGLRLRQKNVGRKPGSAAGEPRRGLGHRPPPERCGCAERIVGPLGHATEQAGTDDALVARHAEANGTVTEFEHDGHGNVLAGTDPSALHFDQTGGSRPALRWRRFFNNENAKGFCL